MPSLFYRYLAFRAIQCLAPGTHLISRLLDCRVSRWWDPQVMLRMDLEVLDGVQGLGEEKAGSVMRGPMVSAGLNTER